MAQTRQSKLILYLIMTVGLVAGYLYGAPPQDQPVVPYPAAVREALAKDTLRQFATMSLRYDALDGDRFKALRIFGEYPVTPGAGGKTNIFAP